MKHEFGKKKPLMRLAFATAALSTTLSVGGFIDFLASGYAADDAKHRPLLTTARKL